MINVKRESRFALYDGDKQITSYGWKNYFQDREYIFLCNEAEVAIYNTRIKNFIVTIPGTMLCYSPEHNYIKIRKDEKIEMYSYEGEKILPTGFPWISDYDIYIAVRDHNDLYGLYSYEGEELVPVSYNDINFDGNYIVNGELRLVEVKKDNIEGFFDIKNKIFVDAQDINITKTGIIEVNKNGSWTVLKS